MEAVITRVVLNSGAVSEWEATMRDRMTAAESSDGWVGGAILTPEGDDGARIVTVVLKAQLLPSGGWRQDEDGAPVPTFSASRADIPD